MLTTLMLCVWVWAQAVITGGYYWLDGEAEAREATTVTGNFTLDVSQLTDGMHTIYWVARDDQGRLSAPVAAHFYVNTVDAARMTVNYVLDHAAELTKATAAPIEGNQTVTLDVSALTDGMHNIRMVFTGNNGVATMAVGHFDKKHIGPVGVMDYGFWVNANTATASIFHLNKPTFLIQDDWMLPEADEFRTASFGLDFTDDGAPIAISLNQLGVVVRNDAGYADFAEAPFGDRRMTRDVHVVADITGGGEFRHAGPTGASIVWYSFTATAGDSVALQTDRSCSLRLFGPTGQELLYTTGAATTAGRGLVLGRAGTHYVALHDADYNYTMTLKFFQQSASAARGDMDGSGVVDVDDLNIIINIMVRKATLESWPAADLDGNGVVDVDDLNHVINIMIRKE